MRKQGKITPHINKILPEYLGKECFLKSQKSEKAKSQWKNIKDNIIISNSENERQKHAFPKHKTVKLQIAGAYQKSQGQTYAWNTADK